MYSTARQQRDCQLTPPSPSMAIFKPFSPLWGPKWGPIRLPMSLRTTNSDFLHLVCRKKVHLSHLGPIARPHRPKNGKNGPPRGPRGQTGSRNMAATTQIDFLTLVSYSTLNTFGVYLAPLRLYPCERLPLRPLQRKSGHFGPFPAPGKLLPVFQIYFLFEPRPQKRCTTWPDGNGAARRLKHGQNTLHRLRWPRPTRSGATGWSFEWSFLSYFGLCGLIIGPRWYKETSLWRTWCSKSEIAVRMGIGSSFGCHFGPRSCKNGAKMAVVGLGGLDY